MALKRLSTQRKTEPNSPVSWVVDGSSNTLCRTQKESVPSAKMRPKLTRTMKPKAMHQSNDCKAPISEFTMMRSSLSQVWFRSVRATRTSDSTRMRRSTASRAQKIRNCDEDRSCTCKWWAKTSRTCIETVATLNQRQPWPEPRERSKPSAAMRTPRSTKKMAQVRSESNRTHMVSSMPSALPAGLAKAAPAASSASQTTRAASRSTSTARATSYTGRLTSLSSCCLVDIRCRGILLDIHAKAQWPNNASLVTQEADVGTSEAILWTQPVLLLLMTESLRLYICGSAGSLSGGLSIGALGGVASLSIMGTFGGMASPPGGLKEGFGGRAHALAEGGPPRTGPSAGSRSSRLSFPLAARAMRRP
mmetsp:Transcript_20385/g.59127  ORF Transcript_20385/g.59127 Transcript_20385/m.59127 type:complete len:363 (+) Transcript_20385:317-1405(+)